MYVTPRGYPSTPHRGQKFDLLMDGSSPFHTAYYIHGEWNEKDADQNSGKNKPESRFSAPVNVPETRAKSAAKVLPVVLTVPFYFRSEHGARISGQDFFGTRRGHKETGRKIDPDTAEVDYMSLELNMTFTICAVFMNKNESTLRVVWKAFGCASKT